MTYLGKQIILELYGCPAHNLSNVGKVERIMKDAALAMEATIVQSNFHHFSPLGISGVVVIMESHLTIHTWPEYNYIAIDIFTCGAIKIDKGIALLKERFLANSSEMQLIERGPLSKLTQGQQNKKP